MIMGVPNNFLPLNFIAFGQLHATEEIASIYIVNTALKGVIVSGLFCLVNQHCRLSDQLNEYEATVPM